MLSIIVGWLQASRCDASVALWRPLEDYTRAPMCHSDSDCGEFVYVMYVFSPLTLIWISGYPIIRYQKYTACSLLMYLDMIMSRPAECDSPGEEAFQMLGGMFGVSLALSFTYLVQVWHI